MPSPAQNVQCPACGAPPGEKCVSLNPTEEERSYGVPELLRSHPARCRAAGIPLSSRSGPTPRRPSLGEQHARLQWKLMFGGTQGASQRGGVGPQRGAGRSQ